MKRTTKNIISTIVIILLISSIGLTIYISKNNLSSNNTQIISGDKNGGQMGTPPEMPSGSGSDSQGTTPPSKPGEENSSTTSDESSTDSKENANSQSTDDSKENSSSNTTSNEPPAKPDGDTSSDGSTPPEMPNGSGSDSQGTTPPEMPSSDGNGQAPSGMPNESSSALTIPYYIIIGVESCLLSAAVIYLIQSGFNKKSFKETYNSKKQVIVIVVVTIVTTAALTFGTTYLTNKFVLTSSSSNQGKMQDNMNSSSNVTYSSATEITESTTISDEEYTSSTADENALSVSGDNKVTLDNVTVTKTGDSDGGDNTSFYGINSAIIAKDGATLTLKNITVTTDATGANGVFSYGGSATTNNSTSDGTTINISDSTITTKKDNSGGIMTTGGGITNASNLTVETAGTSSAAIRTDRGGGTVNVDGGTYKTTGQGSPSIYSTADIIVKNAKLTATASEGIVIEGKNSVTIENTELTDTNNKLNGQSTTYKNIFLYQSMSGDADDGTSEFTAKNSKITTNKGDTFYITNTTATITLENNTIVNNDSEGNFLRAQADSWGTSGSNGGIVTLKMTNQEAEGNIVVDSVSTLDMTLSSSSYTGTINADNSAKSIKLTLDKKSTIKLTGDSYVTSLDNADSTNSNIDFNGYKLYVNGKAIN